MTPDVTSPSAASPEAAGGPPPESLPLTSPEAQALAGEDSQEQPSRRLEIVSALVALAVTSALIVLARQIEVRTETGGIDPRWWPELLGFVGVALSVVLLAVVIRRPVPRDDLQSSTREGWTRLVAAVALTAVYILLWPVVGFLPATCAFLFAVVLLFGARGWKALVIFPIAMTAFIQILFGTLLRVAL